jgi:hypothetical protein
MWKASESKARELVHSPAAISTSMKAAVRVKQTSRRVWEPDGAGLPVA